MVEGTYLLMAAIGILAVVVAVVAFMRVLGSERGARTVGRGADRLADPLTRRLGRGRSVDVTGTLLDFRSSVAGVMQARWVQVSLSTLLLQLASWAVLGPGHLPQPLPVHDGLHTLRQLYPDNLILHQVAEETRPGS